MTTANEPKQAYPLSWPVHQVRKGCRNQSPFGDHSLAECVALAKAEVRRLGGTSLVISSNVPLRQDGLPRGDYARSIIFDKGVAIYFKLSGRDIVLACDKWNQVEHNLYAIARHIEAMRGQERWGVGTVEQQFRGYSALPDRGGTSGVNWWTVLGVDPNVSADRVREVYRTLAKVRHPDVAGGSAPAFQELQEAFRQALQAKGEK